MTDGASSTIDEHRTADQPESRQSLELELTSMDLRIREFCEGWRRHHGSFPDVATMRSAKSTGELLRRRDEVRLMLAPARVEGQCAHYVTRKRRFCTGRASVGNLCSVHANAIADVERALVATEVASQTCSASGANKTNIARTPKRMANPLSIQFLTPPPAPHWQSVFADIGRPLLLDVGCARGRWLQQLARARPEWNFCGIEIYAPLVRAMLYRAVPCHAMLRYAVPCHAVLWALLDIMGTESTAKGRGSQAARHNPANLRLPK